MSLQESIQFNTWWTSRACWSCWSGTWYPCSHHLYKFDCNAWSWIVCWITWLRNSYLAAGWAIRCRIEEYHFLTCKVVRHCRAPQFLRNSMLLAQIPSVGKWRQFLHLWKWRHCRVPAAAPAAVPRQNFTFSLSGLICCCRSGTCSCRCEPHSPATQPC